MTSSMYRAVAISFLAMLPFIGLAVPTNIKPLWTVSFAGFEALEQRQETIGKALGNVMLPMWLMAFMERRLTKGFGLVRRSEPIRWVAFRGKGKAAEIALIYPSVDKVAKMVLNHPGAERRGEDALFLPKGEGRPMDVFVVFAHDFSCYAASPSEATSRLAVKHQYSPCRDALVLLEAGGAVGSFDFKEDALVYQARPSSVTDVTRLKSIPMLGPLVADGRTHRIGFEDLKRLVSSFIKVGKQGNAP